MHAATITVLICQLGGLGTTQQAQPTVDQFMQHMQRAGGWDADGAHKVTLRGVYHTDAKACADYAIANNPEIVVVDIGTYLAQRRSWGLKPIARMSQAENRLYVIAEKKKYNALDKLNGATLATAVSTDPKLLYGVVFKRKVKAGSFELISVKQPLKALRKVLRGKADAALIDHMTYAYLSEMHLPQTMGVVFTSEPLPSLTVATTRHGMRVKGLVNRLRKTLPHLCQDAGQKLCKSIGVTSFEPAKPALYQTLARRYR